MTTAIMTARYFFMYISSRPVWPADRITYTAARGVSNPERRRDELLV
jgi:hypothetical protein